MTDEIDRGRRSFLFGRKKRTPAKLPERAQPERARDAGTPFFARKGRPADGPPMVARIMSHACLVNAGQVCTVCSEHCPEEGAIVFDGRRPVVREDRCTGCGECHQACPAPGNAIDMLPKLGPEQLAAIAAAGGRTGR